MLMLFLAPRGEAQILKLGIRGGVNTGVYSFDDFILNGNVISPHNSGDAGYQFGVVMRLNIPGILYLQPELNYVNRIYGFGVTGINSEAATSFRKISYEKLEFPVAVGLKIAALRLFGGPIFCIESRQTPLGNAKDDLNIKFNQNDIAAFAGIGLDLNHIFFEARCIKYLDKTKSVVTFNDTSRKVQAKQDEYWQFSVGFFF